VSSSALASDRAQALALTPVSRETAARLDRFVELLLGWQRTTQLIDLAPKARIWADMGSGAGFPGLVIACALSEQPGALVHLIESNTKKAAFLREAVAVTAAPAWVHPIRMEKFVESGEGAIEVVTARAVSPLHLLLAECFPLLRSGAVGLFPKGQDIGAELTKASKSWKVTADLVPSRTDSQARIAVVRALERRPRVT